MYFEHLHHYFGFACPHFYLQIDNVRFRELSVEQVFGSLHESLSTIRMSEDSSLELRDLREQLKKKSDIVNRLQADLEHAQRQRMSTDQVP